MFEGGFYTPRHGTLARDVSNLNAEGPPAGPFRILILSASVGAGHLRAAEALECAFRVLHPQGVVKNVDVLSFANAAFRRLYGKTYFDLVDVAPHMIGYIYDWLDRPPKEGFRMGDRLRLLAQRINLRPLLKFLRSEPWNVIVNTHFLPTELVAQLRRAGDFHIPQMTATTDFETHRLWVHQPCERYFTATQEGAAYLHYWGIPAGDISVTGIPIHPDFAEKRRKADAVKKWGLSDRKPVVLQLAGGFGVVGPLEKIARSILDSPVPLTLVVVTGRNAEAQAALKKIKVPPRHHLRVLGYTTEMSEWMAAADLVVSKPGGLTSSECLARGVPMAIVNPIPGQESRNGDYILERGAGIKINNLPTLGQKLTELLLDAPRLRAMGANALRAAKPRAAFQIAQEILDSLSIPQASAAPSRQGTA